MVVAGLSGVDPGIADWLRELSAKRPKPDRDLDHFPATLETLLRRAVYIRDQFPRDRRHLVILGDYDLTSLAVARLADLDSISVVDTDERVLQLIQAEADRWVLPIRTMTADLRIWLPVSVSRSADLVFCDPPYTPAGTKVFLRRAGQALQDGRSGEILTCYGYSPAGPDRALHVQAVLTDLKLVIEEVRPNFNAYSGAESIGGRSSLYRLLPVVLEEPGGWDGEEVYVYTGGARHRARTRQPPSDHVIDAIWRLTPFGEGSRPLLVGLFSRSAIPGWTDAHAVSMGHLAALAHARAQGWRVQPIPPGPVMVDLSEMHASSLPALLAWLPPRPTTILLPDELSTAWRRLSTEDYWLQRLFTAKYSTADTVLVDGYTVLALHPVDAGVSVDPSVWLMRFLLDQVDQKLLNAISAGLDHAARQMGEPMTKRRSRELATEGLPPRLLDCHLDELPAADLRTVVELCTAKMGQISHRK